MRTHIFTCAHFWTADRVAHVEADPARLRCVGGEPPLAASGHRSAEPVDAHGETGAGLGLTDGVPAVGPADSGVRALSSGPTTGLCGRPLSAQVDHPPQQRQAHPCVVLVQPFEGAAAA